MSSHCCFAVSRASVTQRLEEEDSARTEGLHHQAAIMGNTPTAKKGNEMESGEYLPPGNKCSSVRLSFDRCVQESVCCHSQLVSATSLTCNAQGPIALRCIALFIPERRPVRIIAPSLSFLQITWLFINIKLFVCLLRRPFLCEAILACEVSSWRIL